MTRRRLDLPLPLGPVSTKAPPAGSVKLSRRKTSRSPRRQARSRPLNSVAVKLMDAAAREAERVRLGIGAGAIVPVPLPQRKAAATGSPERNAASVGGTEAA